MWLPTWIPTMTIPDLLTLDVQPDLTAPAILEGLLAFGQRCVDELHATAIEGGSLFGITRLRGTGPGVSFNAVIDALNRQMPLEPAFPFEGSDKVGGAVWPERPSTLQTPDGETPSNAVAKLQWKAGADDLPMHTHLYSDRCIVVHEGRGFFHWTTEPYEAFTGETVHTIAVRERDVLVFGRGVVHTFSTTAHPMQLISMHLPFLPFDSPRQYHLPPREWTLRSDGHRIESRIVAENTWSHRTITQGSAIRLRPPKLTWQAMV